MTRMPVPPFSQADAVQKVRLAENVWNGRDPEAVGLAYTPDTRWRNRSTFLTGRAAVVKFLSQKWVVEHDYRLIKEFWAHGDSQIAVRFCYEYHDYTGQWFRAHGNENWAFNSDGYMAERHASINDVPIDAADRLFHWPQGPRPTEHSGLSEMGL
jgi:nuclear transport factor 2 (NTF2) superfamily protein